ncbi:hypothetical protein L585_12890 [Pantoea ananatis BRT175]|nr:hypothetical protein L585_12890 [Pantoea ananatis BRT175]
MNNHVQDSLIPLENKGQNLIQLMHLHVYQSHIYLHQLQINESPRII